MATALAKSERLIRYAKALFGSGYQGAGAARQFCIARGGEQVEVLQSGNDHTGRVFLLTPGFGARLTDYGPLVKLFEEKGLVVRVRHAGSGRVAALRALLKLLLQRLSGRSGQEAALGTRAWIHQDAHRFRRLKQLRIVEDYYREQLPECRLSVIGHSFGTDTALLFALQRETDGLYLFSNHPPGYLIAQADYASLKANEIRVITGTRDTTRDGVRPEQRLRIADFLASDRVGGVHCLEGVAHMDFAFSGWGPKDWPRELQTLLSE